MKHKDNEGQYGLMVESQRSLNAYSAYFLDHSIERFKTYISK